MGYMRHHAIIVTASYPGENDIHFADIAHRKATDLGMTVTPIVVSPVNDVRSFMVATDGSKEGWGESDLGDEQRGSFVTWLRDQAYDDGSSPYSWVEIQYGDDDNRRPLVLRCGEDDQ